MRIRPYDHADWQAIAVVHDQARLDELRVSVGLDAFKTLEQTAEAEGLFDDAVWVAELEGAVVGFVAMAGGEVTWLYVRPDHYRRGVGRALLRHACAHADGELETSVLDGNDSALSLYMSEGFEIVETRTGSLLGMDHIQASGHILRRPGTDVGS